MYCAHNKNCYNHYVEPSVTLLRKLHEYAIFKLFYQ